MKVYRNRIIETQFRMPAWPVNANDFVYLQDDKEFERVLNEGEASLYFIVKRPCLVFKELFITQGNRFLTGKIYQPYSEKAVTFCLDLYQDNLIDGLERNLFFSYCENKSIDSQNVFTSEELHKNSSIDVILIYEEDKETLIRMLTPDLLIRQYYWSTWKFIEFTENYTDFLKFQVLYTGEAAKNSKGILGRLRIHEKLKNILMTEYPKESGMHISKELLVLIFEIKETKIVANNYLIDDEGKKVKNENSKVPKQNIYLDAEKAFINFLPTKLNSGKPYNAYPISKDGIFPFKYENILYSILDPIELSFDDKQFRGSFLKENRDFLHANINKNGVKKISLNTNGHEENFVIEYIKLLG